MTAANIFEKKHNLLLQLAEIVESSLNLSEKLNNALKLLAHEPNMKRGAITLISPLTGRIRIEASYGLNASQRKRGEYLPGEGITGRVIAKGKPMCIADVCNEPLFLNKTGSRDMSSEHIAFICVPLYLCGQVVGALSLDKSGLQKHDLENELTFLRIFASILAHAAYETDMAINDDRPFGFVGNSENMRHIYEQIQIVAPAQTTVLLEGESGTGKELAARAIHCASQRSNAPFIALNCAALPENLLESELFGHEKGAFTGAFQIRKGRFELAQGGTLFLDEIGELSPLVQAKLLRVLQERSFERLGGMKQIQADVRLVAATNRNLAEMVEKGDFRRDLFYRLNVFPIFLPPLRERSTDILPLAVHFLRNNIRKTGKKMPRFSLEAIEMLEKYIWPGNVRELQNVMERASLLLGKLNIILPEHLGESIISAVKYSYQDAEKNLCKAQTLNTALEDIEKETILNILAQSEGKLNIAAKKLGITPRILGLRMKKYGLSYKDFRKKQ